MTPHNKNLKKSSEKDKKREKPAGLWTLPEVLALSDKSGNILGVSEAIASYSYNGHTHAALMVERTKEE
jgi:hypothetical protein